MKIGFICPPAPGHFNPMSALARQLQSRNHDVVMISMPAIEPLARAANLPFLPRHAPSNKAATGILPSKSTVLRNLTINSYLKPEN
jgi:UDP:flavonoid glycosyltransferase YjiC (YdhE family)